MRYETNALRILDCKEEGCSKIIAGAPDGLNYLCEACAEHFGKLRKWLESSAIPYELDKRLVRGLDYYNRTVFEVKSPLLGAQSTVSAGGRYDYLVREIGGTDTPASGFALGMERLAILLEKSGKLSRNEYYIPPMVYLAYIGYENMDNARSLLSTLRKKGITAVSEYRYANLKKHLKAADAMRAKFALFLGSDEVASGRYTLRNLSTGEQSRGTIDYLIKSILKMEKNKQ
jgi:histidyl-tRNA synthetase